MEINTTINTPYHLNPSETKHFTSDNTDTINTIYVEVIDTTILLVKVNNLHIHIFHSDNDSLPNEDVFPKLTGTTQSFISEISEINKKYTENNHIECFVIGKYITKKCIDYCKDQLNNIFQCETKIIPFEYGDILFPSNDLTMYPTQKTCSFQTNKIQFRYDINSQLITVEGPSIDKEITRFSYNGIWTESLVS